ncbi:MAG: hypothetical protein BZY87_04070 [SAR202 cluster bacterium Io17-Chloro-G6]|nr:MAG: hypothetical protein BZY87_04070 [SAR202 cluster bacterium Io17-Chloro-G6]
MAVFDNEPLARLAVQRLQGMGIPALTRCLRGGPGLWGSAYNLPHDIVVYESDEVQARSLLDLEPAENMDLDNRDHGSLGPGEEVEQPARESNLGIILIGAVLGVLFLVLMISVFARPIS